MTTKRGFRRRSDSTANYPAGRAIRRTAAALGAAVSLAAGLAACGAAPQPDFTPEPEPTEDAGLPDAGADGGETR